MVATPKTLSPGRALIGLALLMAAALLAESVNIHSGVLDATSDLSRSQAVAFYEALRGHIFAAEGDISTANLQEVLDEHKQQGLRYISIGKGKFTAGAGNLSDPAMAPDARFGMRVEGDRVRASFRRGSRRRRRNRRARPMTPRRMRWRLLKDTVLEFEPLTSNRMLARSQRNVVISLVVAALMIALAWATARWLRRRSELQEQLNQKRRLASLGEMSAVLAHEIRNPLASLKGHAQLLEEIMAMAEDPPPKADRKVKQVVKEAQRLENLVNELLEFVRTGEVDRRDASPISLIRDVIDDPERVEVRDQNAPTTWKFDGPRLSRVMRNLIDNALQASPEQAKVVVTVAERADMLHIEVEDQGSGIDAADLEAVFEPFRTGRTRGTGLGLAVARRIVEAHDGTLVAENRDDGGARFTLRIPRA